MALDPWLPCFLPFHKTSVQLWWDLLLQLWNCPVVYKNMQCPTAINILASLSSFSRQIYTVVWMGWDHCSGLFMAAHLCIKTESIQTNQSSMLGRSCRPAPVMTAAIQDGKTWWVFFWPTWRKPSSLLWSGGHRKGRSHAGCIRHTRHGFQLRSSDTAPSCCLQIWQQKWTSMTS